MQPKQQVSLGPTAWWPMIKNPAQAIIQVTDRSASDLLAIEDTGLRVLRADGQQAGAHFAV